VNTPAAGDQGERFITRFYYDLVYSLVKPIEFPQSKIITRTRLLEIYAYGLPTLHPSCYTLSQV